VSELIEKGYVTRSSKVFAYVLGDRVSAAESGETTKFDGRVVIRPQLYSVFIGQAEKRLFNLRDRIKDAPFLREEEIETYLQGTPEEQAELAV